MNKDREKILAEVELINSIKDLYNANIKLSVGFGVSRDQVQHPPVDMTKPAERLYYQWLKKYLKLTNIDDAHPFIQRIFVSVAQAQKRKSPLELRKTMLRWELLKNRNSRKKTNSFLIQLEKLKKPEKIGIINKEIFVNLSVKGLINSYLTEKQLKETHALSESGSDSDDSTNTLDYDEHIHEEITPLEKEYMKAFEAFLEYQNTPKLVQTFSIRLKLLEETPYSMKSEIIRSLQDKHTKTGVLEEIKKNIAVEENMQTCLTKATEINNELTKRIDNKEKKMERYPFFTGTRTGQRDSSKKLQISIESLLTGLKADITKFQKQPPDDSNANSQKIVAEFKTKIEEIQGELDDFITEKTNFGDGGEKPKFEKLKTELSSAITDLKGESSDPSLAGGEAKGNYPRM